MLTPTRLIVLLPLHYRSYSAMLQSDHASLAISKVVIWEQVSICYSLMSITWPFSKQWIKSFDTSRLAVVTGYGSSGPTGASASAPRSKTHASQGISLTRRSWHEIGAGHSSAVYGAGKVKDDRGSGSQEMIIRREDEVEVTFEDGRSPSRSVR